MTVTEFLQQHVPFLSGLTEDQAHYLAKSAEQLVFRKGQTVIFRGVTVDGLHVVAAGKVTVHAKIGREVQQVAELGPGAVFGETSIIEMTVAAATIKSAEDETLIFVLPEDAFRKILKTDADFQAKVTALIAERKQANEERNKPKS
ncbi:MAG: cyclic nucleotide-binding domain-containing protein [Elusimicrobia bacterium]|nr:cyclic nucleotide-binding domain-containing protein [Elusimicrobiota bacterium]